MYFRSSTYSLSKIAKQKGIACAAALLLIQSNDSNILLQEV